MGDTCHIYGLKAKDATTYFYVGSTKRDLEWRLGKHRNHCASGLHRNPEFNRVVKEIGIDNLAIELIETVPQEQRFQRESYWINKLPNLVNAIKNPAKQVSVPSSPTPRRAGGRPTKYTPENVELILDAIRTGAPFTHACRYGGISFETFNEWRKQYSEFSEQVKEAEGEAVKGWLDQIETAAKNGSWQAAAWKLERRYPHEFGRRDRMPIDERELQRQFEAEMERITAGGEAGLSAGAESTAVN